MSNTNPASSADELPSLDNSGESFGDIFSRYEKKQPRKPQEPSRGIEGTVVTVTADSVLVDIGFKTEGIIPLATFQNTGKAPKPGNKIVVSIKGRDPEGYYELSLGRIERPRDWAALERAFAEKATIVGTVTSVVKGGLSVDVGVRAFLPASRSGTRDAAEMQRLVEQEIRCRITKLDSTEEDVVVDRRVVVEEEERAAQDRRYLEMNEGAILNGTVRSLMDYGAFVDIGGIDALLHVSDISRSRVAKPSEALSVGQEIQVKVLKIDPEKRRISVGMKQLGADPWDSATAKYKPGDRVRGTVIRVLDFGAFAELEPGLEGLIHVSEMSWAKKVRTPSDIVKPGDIVEVVILGINIGERRMSLGLKQALGDPWADVSQKIPVGSTIEGPVTSITKFGAFVQLVEGIEGMVHVSDISAEKRIDHPQDVLKLGQIVKAQVLEVDTEKRRVKLGMKQVLPTSIDEYIAERKEGDVVSGRVVEISGGQARIELGEGIYAVCQVKSGAAASEPGTQVPASKTDVSSLTSMLQARWKGGATSASSKQDPIRGGQIRNFRITRLNPTEKKIEVQMAE
jgi:small subunit ribosomal protein S1